MCESKEAAAVLLEAYRDVTKEIMKLISTLFIINVFMFAFTWLLILLK